MAWLKCRATNGDTHLGGDDWDRAISDWIVSEQFLADQGIDVGKRPASIAARARSGSEKAKIELSSTMQTEINLPFITADASGPKHLQMNVDRGPSSSN